MSADELRDAREDVPFRPYVLRMADGRQFHIRHRDFLSVSPDGRTAIVWREHGGHHTLDAQLITELDVDPVPAPPAPMAG